MAELSCFLGNVTMQASDSMVCSVFLLRFYMANGLSVLAPTVL